MTVTLRPYQSFMVAQIYQHWQQGDRNVLGVLPTGAGKSVCISQVALDRDQMGANQCIMAHRTELVSQMAMHIARREVKHRIIAPDKVVREITRQQRAMFGRSFVNPDARCAVAAAQTLSARADSLKAWGATVHNWTVDESHHLTAKNLWGRAVGLFPNALGLGVTATPQRADGMGLGRHADGLIDAMLIGPSMRELIDEGSLTDYEIAVPQSDFHIDDEAVTNSGDYSPVKMREASKKSHITGDVVKEYSQRAFGRRAICFATDVQTANEIANNFNAAGIPAASVSAQTPTEVRADYIRKFNEGLLWILVNVDLFDEGFDVPGCDVVIMARPTASLGKFMQQFGRALRPDPNNPNKVALVIDHVSNWLRHGFPDKPRAWTLDRREKRAKKEPDPEEIPLTVCRSCSRPYERFYAACPYCGEQPAAAGGTRNIEQVDGDLLLLDREKLAEMRKAIELESPASVSERVGFAAGPLAAKGAYNAAVARHEAQKRLSDAIAQWAALERAKGRPDSQTYRRFFLTTGQDVLTALTGKRDDLDRLANMVEGWYK